MTPDDASPLSPDAPPGAANGHGDTRANTQANNQANNQGDIGDPPPLDSRYTATSGRVFLTGTQALVRLMMEQARNDAAAGLATGGGEALDGLVRAFIAAGGRQVIASHWPAPDDFDATERLFNGFYKAKNASIGNALRTSQTSLMDDPLTSHPYYWAGFAIVGDAARPVPAH